MDPLYIEKFDSIDPVTIRRALSKINRRPDTQNDELFTQVVEDEYWRLKERLFLNYEYTFNKVYGVRLNKVEHTFDITLGWGYQLPANFLKRIEGIKSTKIEFTKSIMNYRSTNYAEMASNASLSSGPTGNLTGGIGNGFLNYGGQKNINPLHNYQFPIIKGQLIYFGPIINQVPSSVGGGHSSPFPGTVDRYTLDYVSYIRDDDRTRKIPGPIQDMIALELAIYLCKNNFGASGVQINNLEKERRDLKAAALDL